MDAFEKQQLAESIKAIVKARWFFASVVFIQGFIIKTLLPNVPLATTKELSFILILSFLYNFGYLLYLRRPPEKLTDFGLKLVKNLQVPLDASAISTILYFSGTVDKMVMVWYFVSLMISISLHKKTGIILNTLFISSLYSGLVILEYYGFLRYVPLGNETFSSAFKNLSILTGRLVGFNSYVIASAFFVWFIGNLFRTREQKLEEKTKEAVQKTETLTLQTRELVQNKSLLQEALIKSIEAKTELEKANIELKAKIDELERFSKVTVGRELKMAELKQKIRELEEKTGG